MLADAGKSFEGQRVVISGSGNVATYANQKATQLGGKVIAMSDSNGYIVDENGIDYKVIKEIKEVKRARIKTYLDYVPTARVRRGQPGHLDRPLRHRPALRHPERAAPGRCQGSGCQWLLLRSRGCQHAFHPGCHRLPAAERHPVCPR